MSAWQEQESAAVTHGLHPVVVSGSPDLARDELRLSDDYTIRSRRIDAARPGGTIALNGGGVGLSDGPTAGGEVTQQDVESVYDQSAEHKALFTERNGLITVQPLIATGLSKKAAEEYLGARVTFVNTMGWLGETASDVDAYDESPNTLYSLKMRETNDGQEGIGFVAGLRLTEVPAITESMSFEMLAQNPDMQETVAENSLRDEGIRRATAGGRFWDVTRQVAQLDGSASLEEVSKGVPEAFGMGIGITCPPNERDTVWFFATTKKLKDYLERSGVPLKVLTEGYVSPGDEQSGAMTYFCYTKPVETMERAYSGVADNRRQARFYQDLIKGAELAGRVPNL